MKKLLTGLIGISVLIASLSVVYYFVIFLPKKENQKLEQLKQQTELSRQQFEYQKKKDETEKINQAIKEVQSENQSNWERARTECIDIANRNLDSFEKAVNNCQTQLCIDNMLANKELQNFGEGFIESCIENRL